MTLYLSLTIFIYLIQIFSVNAQDDCMDNDPNCPLFLQNGFCQSTLYTFDQKLQYCKKSCGFCGCLGTTVTPPSDCLDGDVNCALFLQNRFCQSALYTFDQKLQYCKKSCGFCGCQPSNNKCPADWTYSSTLNSCYRVANQTGGINFTEADTACKSFGGLLTSLHSQAELDFVNDLAGFATPVATLYHTLIGGVRNGPALGAFRWIDGTPVDFTPYATGEPDNINGRQDCMQLWTSKITPALLLPGQADSTYFRQMDDVDCDPKFLNAVCKRAPIA